MPADGAVAVARPSAMQSGMPMARSRCRRRRGRAARRAAARWRATRALMADHELRALPRPARDAGQDRGAGDAEQLARAPRVASCASAASSCCSSRCGSRPPPRNARSSTCPSRRAARPLRRHPGGRQQRPPLGARHHEAGALHRMRHLFRAIAEGHRGRGRIVHAVAQRRQRRVEAAKQRGGLVGRAPPAPPRALRSGRRRSRRRSRPASRSDARSRGSRGTTEPGGSARHQRVDQLADAARQRHERAARRGRRLQRAEGPQHAAVLALRIDQARKQRTHRQPIDVAGVDAGQQRLGQVVHGLAAEAAAHERGDRLVLVVVPRARAARAPRPPSAPCRAA